MNLGERLKTGQNSLNALRLLFAVLVIVSHSFSLLGLPEPAYAGLPLGAWAVAGFFAISGYLIPRARLRTDLGSFLMRRARRIYPAFWTCCAVIAFAFSPLASHLTGVGYQRLDAVTYALTNATTYMGQQVIGTETLGAPADLVMWNAPAWTLVFEITCYAIAGAVLTLDAARRHHITAAVLVCATATTTALATGSQHGLAWFVTLFAAGWVVSTVADHLRPTTRTSLLALCLAVAAAAIHPALAALPLAYAVLSAGALLPTRWCTTNDVSYGTYLYGWPLQQLLIAFGVDALGLVVFLPVAIALALFAGAASWFLLERHLLAHRGSRPTAAESRQVVTQTS